MSTYPCVSQKEPPKLPWWFLLAVLGMALLMCLIFSQVKAEEAELWKITAYCSCFKCCGKADSITASGIMAKKGFCTLNWLPFGTSVKIEGFGIYKVMDRGAKSLFGSIKNHIKHIDIWFPSHKEAVRFGVQYRRVEIL